MKKFFAEVLEIKNGRNQKAVENPDGLYPIYGSGGIMGRADDYICNAGTVIVGRKGTINNPIFVNEPFWNVDTAFGLEANKDVLYPKYLFYFCKNFDFESLNTTVTIPSLTKNNLLKIQMPIVSLSEQQKIAAELDTIQSAIDNKKQQLSLLDEAVKSEFVEMFGDPVLNEKGWKLKTLPELGEFGRGISKHRPRNAPELLGGKYPLIQTGDIANANLYITEYKSTYSEEGYKQSKMWKAGTLCITIAATIAKTAILTFDSCFPDSVVGFTPNENTNSLFINYWFTFFQKILEDQAPGVAQKNINLQFLSNLKIFTPPIELQNTFATFVQQIDKSKFVVKQQIADLQELLDSKMQEYFS